MSKDPSSSFPLTRRQTPGSPFPADHRASTVPCRPYTRGRDAHSPAGAPSPSTHGIEPRKSLWFLTHGQSGSRRAAAPTPGRLQCNQNIPALRKPPKHPPPSGTPQNSPRPQKHPKTSPALRNTPKHLPPVSCPQRFDSQAVRRLRYCTTSPVESERKRATDWLSNSPKTKGPEGAGRSAPRAEAQRNLKRGDGPVAADKTKHGSLQGTAKKRLAVPASRSSSDTSTVLPNAR